MHDRRAEGGDDREVVGITDERVLTIVQNMIHERQRLLIRDANHLRELVGLPPVRAEGEGTHTASEAACRDALLAGPDTQHAADLRRQRR